MKNIRFGSTYDQKYLSNNYNFKEIKSKEGYAKSYKIWNKSDAQVFVATLNILADGRAITEVNYVSYSGVKNKYKNYFNTQHEEIIHNKNSSKEELIIFNACV